MLIGILGRVRNGELNRANGSHNGLATGHSDPSGLLYTLGCAYVKADPDRFQSLFSLDLETRRNLAKWLPSGDFPHFLRANRSMLKI